MEQQRNEVLRGTLNLMVLKTLSTLGPLHGFGGVLRSAGRAAAAGT